MAVTIWCKVGRSARLQALVGGATDALTFTAVPPGSGWRIGLDRNSDGLSDQRLMDVIDVAL